MAAAHNRAEKSAGLNEFYLAQLMLTSWRMEDKLGTFLADCVCRETL